MILSNELFSRFSLQILWDFFSTQNRLHNIYRGFTHYKYYRAIFYSVIHFCLQKIAGSSVRVPTTIFNLMNIYKVPLGVSWYLYILWSLLIIYGLLSVVIKSRKALFLVSIFAYILTLFIQSDIFIVQRTLVWGVCFLLGSILSEINLCPVVK